MSTPIGQLGGGGGGNAGAMAPSTKPSDVELIEQQLMNNPGATLAGSDMGAPQAPRIDVQASPAAVPGVAFPAQLPPGYGHSVHAPPAVPPPHRSALDEYAFPIALFIITVIALSPFVEGLLKRFVPSATGNVWMMVGIKAALVAGGFMVLDKLNQ